MNRQPDDPGTRRYFILRNEEPPLVDKLLPDPQPDDEPDNDQRLRAFRRAITWGFFWALVAIAVGTAMIAFAKETDAGQERPPCESDVPMCCWAPGSLPVCQLDN